MLDDRVYMRRSSFDARRSATVMLVIALVAAFLGQQALKHFSSFPVNEYLALSLSGLRHGFVWQLLSFQFLHAGWMHLILNCLVIYFFGRELEETLGVKRFLALYFLSGTIGGLVQTLFGLALPSQFGGGVLGASAGGFGLVAAFATLFPERTITLLLFFILPINLRAKYLLLISAVVTVYGILVPGGNVAHAAHLGGLLTGVFFIRYAPYWRWPSFPNRRPRPVRKMARVPSPGSLWGRNKPAPQEEPPPEDFLSKEVDPILDKISAQGIQSLTDRERRILEAARERMAKR